MCHVFFEDIPCAVVHPATGLVPRPPVTEMDIPHAAVHPAAGLVPQPPATGTDIPCAAVHPVSGLVPRQPVTATTLIVVEAVGPHPADTVTMFTAATVPQPAATATIFTVAAAPVTRTLAVPSNRVNSFFEKKLSSLEKTQRTITTSKGLDNHPPGGGSLPPLQWINAISHVRGALAPVGKSSASNVITPSLQSQVPSLPPLSYFYCQNLYEFLLIHYHDRAHVNPSLAFGHDV